MNNYYIGPDGELRHGIGDWFKKDAKYIKREWKNGRWQYTYPKDLKGNARNESPKGKLAGKSDKDTLNRANGYYKPENNLFGRVTTGINRAAGRISSAVNAGREMLENYAEGVKRDWEESEQRGTEQARARASAQNRQGTTEMREADTLLSSTTTISSLQSGNTSTYNRGRLDRFMDTAKEFIKDRLGYDERDALTVADARYRQAENVERHFQDRVSAANLNMGTIDPYDGSITYTDEEKKRLERLTRQQQMLRDNTTQAGREASEAADAYFNTPIGRVEKAAEAGKDWLERLFGKRR